jgi:hypothetical protein
MGRADAALIANESFQGLAAARVIVEAAGGKFSRLDGSEFFLNEYLDGQKIDDHLLVAAPDNLPLVRKCLSGWSKNDERQRRILSFYFLHETDHVRFSLDPWTLES